jgi:hypothetical protein
LAVQRRKSHERMNHLHRRVHAFVAFSSLQRRATRAVRFDRFF